MDWGKTNRIGSIEASADDPAADLPGTNATAATALLRRTFDMNRWKRTIKGIVVAGACGVGLCALAKRYKLVDRLADLAQNVEGVPFPGGRLYSFLAGRQLKSLYGEIAQEIANSEVEGKVLDIGTDMGYIPIYLATLNPSLAVVGLDISGDMVQIAEANARSEGVSGKPEFGVGDPTNLPFPGRYFDLAVSVNVLHHWSDARAVLEEAYHVLSPGGEFWIFDYRQDIPEELLAELGEKLPPHRRVLFELGPVSAARSAPGEREIVKMAGDAHFEVLSAEERSLTMFGERMPLFTKIRLRKPTVVREQQPGAPSQTR